MPSRAEELTGVLLGVPWFRHVLEIVASVGLPDWLVGAGAVRDVCWDVRFGDGAGAASVDDVDVVFYDPSDLSPERDAAAQATLTDLDAAIRWDATNQAAVHRWYPDVYGVEVDPLPSTTAGVATWPETATAVGVRLEPDGTLTVVSPLGLDDLLDGVWRRNPVRVTPAEYERRLAKKQPTARWPGVRVLLA